MHRLPKMPEDSLLKDTIQDAGHSSPIGNWAGEVQKQFANHGMASPFSSGFVGTVDVLAFRQCFPRKCLSARAGLCRPELSLRLVPSCASVSAGLLGLIDCWWSPWPTRSSDCCFTSAWAHNCRLSNAGLQGQACQDIYVAARFAPIGPWVLTAFRLSASSVQGPQH